MLSLAPVVTACLAGWLLVRRLRPAAGLGSGWPASLLELGLGAGFGIGLTSMVFFLLTIAGIASAGSVLLGDLVILAALAAPWLFGRKRVVKESSAAAQDRNSAGRLYRLVLAGFLAACLIVVLDGMRLQATAEPHGLWDAWAIWNVRAKFLAGPGETWRYAVSPLLARTHPDYPLLLSGAIARGWKLSGGYPIAAPIAIAVVFFLATVAVLIAALTLLRTVSAGLLAALAAMTGYIYLFQPMTQYSDIPLAYYYLAAMALAALAWKAEENRKPMLLAAAGFAAGCAAWTKNEGLLFAAVFGCCFAAAEWWFSGFGRALRRSLWLGAGMLPGLLLVGALKAFIAPLADPMVREGHRRVAEGARQGWRLQWLRTSLLRNFQEFGYSLPTHPAALVAVLGATLRFALPAALRPAVACGAATVALVFGGYVVVSLGTFTPFSRFYSQLFPLFLLVFFLALRPLEELVGQPAVEAQATPEPPRKKIKKRRP